MNGKEIVSSLSTGQVPGRSKTFTPDMGGRGGGSVCLLLSAIEQLLIMVIVRLLTGSGGGSQDKTSQWETCSRLRKISEALLLLRLQSQGTHPDLTAGV